MVRHYFPADPCLASVQKLTQLLFPLLLIFHVNNLHNYVMLVLMGHLFWIRLIEHRSVLGYLLLALWQAFHLVLCWNLGHARVGALPHLIVCSIVLNFNVRREICLWLLLLSEGRWRTWLGVGHLDGVVSKLSRDQLLTLGVVWTSCSGVLINRKVSDLLRRSLLTGANLKTPWGALWLWWLRRLELAYLGYMHTRPLIRLTLPVVASSRLVLLRIPESCWSIFWAIFKRQAAGIQVHEVRRINTFVLSSLIEIRRTGDYVLG